MTAAGLAGFCAVAVGPDGALGLVAGREPIGQQVNEAADDLAQANAKVNKVTEELQGAQAQLDEAQERLDAALTRGQEAEATAARAREAVKKAEAAVAELEKQLVVLRADVAELRAEIGLLARILYTSGGSLDEVQIILDSRDPADFAERMASVTRVSRGNSQVLERLAAAKAKMDNKLAEAEELEGRAQARREEAANKAQEAADATAVSQAARSEVAQLVHRKRKIVSKANSERGSVQAQYDELRAEQRRIADKIRAALKREEEARQREAAKKRPNNSKPKPGGSTSPSEPTVPSKPPGALGWPLPGYSAGGRTGPRIHPIYGYSSCHTGDDIGAPSGTPIRAAAAGYVVSTDTGGPYGYHTVVSHGGGLSTMYAHQSGFAVSEGQRVRRGQVIGYVGSTGYSTGPHLHFEVHVYGVPWEPMGWFGGSKYRVTCA